MIAGIGCIHPHCNCSPAEKCDGVAANDVSCPGCEEGLPRDDTGVHHNFDQQMMVCAKLG